MQGSIVRWYKRLGHTCLCAMKMTYWELADLPVLRMSTGRSSRIARASCGQWARTGLAKQVSRQACIDGRHA